MVVRGSTALTAEAAEPHPMMIVDSFAPLHFAARAKRGVKRVDRERRVYELYWRECVGGLPLAHVTAAHVRAVITRCADGRITSSSGAKLARTTVRHVRSVLYQLFDAAWQLELVRENPVARVRLWTLMRPDKKRPRELLTDAEISSLVEHPAVPLAWKVITLLGRAVGGMRVGDMCALTWRDFSHDLSRCTIPRRKTDSPQRLLVPEPVCVILGAWKRQTGGRTGFVLPGRGGKPRRTLSAKRFRSQLLVAGVDRHELHHDTATSLRTDIHSLRRAYCTALARAQVNQQTAMILAGHRSPRVHQGYVARSIQSMPENALPEALQSASVVTPPADEQMAYDVLAALAESTNAWLLEEIAARVREVSG